MCKEGGAADRFSSLYDAIHGWMRGRIDRWKASRKTTMTSFTICNYLCKANNIWGKYEGNRGEGEGILLN